MTQPTESASTSALALLWRRRHKRTPQDDTILSKTQKDAELTRGRRRSMGQFYLDERKTALGNGVEKKLAAQEKEELVKHRLVSLNCLPTLGLIYAREEYSPPTKLLGEGYKHWFSGKKTVEMFIKFSPEADNNDYFITSIYNRAKEGDFALSDWLKQNVARCSRSPFRLLSYSGSFEQRLEGFLAFLEYIFSMPEMAAILSGEAWDDVPFDWGEMK